MKSVAINGYGTIGKRVADAVAAQDDMKVIGVSKTRPNYEARTAVEEKGYDLYIGIPERANQFKEAGIEIAGTVEDMIQEADVVVDCTPGTIGPQNLEMYKKAGVKAIYQGGEDHELTGLSFNAISNYDDSYGKDYTRVVSCNTTGLTRTLSTIDPIADIKKVIEETKNFMLNPAGKSILFIDEIHRFNKLQQDALLPYVENGTIILIGATTENPYFEVNKALISRSMVIKLEPLTIENIYTILKNALKSKEGLRRI